MVVLLMGRYKNKFLLSLQISKLGSKVTAIDIWSIHYRSPDSLSRPVSLASHWEWNNSFYGLVKINRLLP